MPLGPMSATLGPSVVVVVTHSPTYAWHLTRAAHMTVVAAEMVGVVSSYSMRMELCSHRNRG
jgi:hypothetical protein